MKKEMICLLILVLLAACAPTPEPTPTPTLTPTATATATATLTFAPTATQDTYCPVSESFEAMKLVDSIITRFTDQIKLIQSTSNKADYSAIYTGMTRLKLELDKVSYPQCQAVAISHLKKSMNHASLGLNFLMDGYISIATLEFEISTISMNSFVAEIARLTVCMPTGCKP